MKKLSLILMITITVSLHISANNIEAIYGKNDTNMNNSYMKLYGNNFGNILEFDHFQPRYVDISNANFEIDTLRNTNESFSVEIELYRTEIESNQSIKSEITNLIDKIDLLLVDLTSTSAELYTLNTTLTDKELRRKLQISIEENRQQKYDLENKKIDMQTSICVLNRVIVSSEKFVTVNNLFISRNNKKINYLKECIQYSDQDTTTLNNAVNKTTSYQREVDSLLNVSF